MTERDVSRVLYSSREPGKLSECRTQIAAMNKMEIKLIQYIKSFMISKYLRMQRWLNMKFYNMLVNKFDKENKHISKHGTETNNFLLSL